MKIAKTGLVPSGANLLPDHGSFADLEEACLVHHGEGVSGEAVLIRKRGQQNLVAGLQAATAAQRGGMVM